MILELHSWKLAADLRSRARDQHCESFLSEVAVRALAFVVQVFHGNTDLKQSNCALYPSGPRRRPGRRRIMRDAGLTDADL